MAVGSQRHCLLDVSSVESNGPFSPSMKNTEHPAIERHFDSVQILRAIAAWTVVYHHYIQVYGVNFTQAIGRGFSRYGSFGVDVFFLISGFIMFQSVRNRPQTAIHFLFRRITRIVPNYWFFTTVVLVCCLAAPNTFASWIPFTLESLVKSLLFIPHQNPSGIGANPLLTVGWTLNYEMFFYVLFAICMLIPRKCTPFAAIVLLVSLRPLQQAFPRLLLFLGPFGTLLSGCYLQEFGFGICIGVVHAWCSPNGQLSRLAGVAVGLCSVAFLFAGGRRDLAAAGILWGTLCFDANSRQTITKFARHLGNTSYSTYLCHAIVLSAALGLTGKPTGPWMELAIIAIVTGLTFALAEVSYRLIERRTLISACAHGLAGVGVAKCRNTDRN